MEKSKTAKTAKAARTKSGAGSEKIKAAYIESVLENGKQPASVYKFCIDYNLKEDAFYSQFGSFEALDKEIWKGYMTRTITSLHGDKSFEAFNAREKMLALYFTLAEVLKANRSFILLQLDNYKKPELVPNFLKEFKSEFEEFVSTILTEGKSKGEVAARPYLDKRYPQLFWVHLSFFLLFWKDDDSKGFEKSDAFIEKSVNLAFDLIGKGAFDTAIDFVKFLYQSKMK
jgi:AcrR family transcriptional regulator